MRLGGILGLLSVVFMHSQTEKFTKEMYNFFKDPAGFSYVVPDPFNSYFEIVVNDLRDQEHHIQSLDPSDKDFVGMLNQYTVVLETSDLFVYDVSAGWIVCMGVVQWNLLRNIEMVVVEPGQSPCTDFVGDDVRTLGKRVDVCGLCAHVVNGAATNGACADKSAATEIISPPVISLGPLSLAVSTAFIFHFKSSPLFVPPIKYIYPPMASRLIH
ncbi:hypothetical protein BJ742DRAFT_898929 [Cladochytrium replicatum]|nr:hypothetical protein BJ742DRAFT_898929 [Cladochytrium replicatum]